MPDEAATDRADCTASIVPPRVADPGVSSWDMVARSPLMSASGLGRAADAPPASPSPGFTAYRMEGLLGRGGMGEVWAAEQVSLGRRVAVKRLIPGTDDDTQVVRVVEFRHEAHVAGRLEHPNIVPVHDLGHDAEGYPLLVMKLIEGRSWHDRLSEDWAVLTPDEFLSRHIPILMATTQAVAFAHSRGIIHRDIKPAQVMVGEFGEVLLTDWGLAIHADAAGQGAQRPATTFPWSLPTPATASNPAGTPALMAPEQTLPDARLIGPWTDVYLLGATLYHLLTGEYPHSGRGPRAAMQRAAAGEVIPPSQRCPGRPVPPDLEALCLRALHPNPEGRLESAQAFWQGLDDHVRGSSRRARSREVVAAAHAALDARPADYAAFAAILAKVEEARHLWPDNPACDPLRARGLAGSARQALLHGDLSLARFQAAAIADLEVARPILADLDRADAAVRRRRAQFRAALATVVLLLLVVAVGSMLFTRQLHAKNLLLAQRTDEAIEARRTAEANLAIARQQGDGAFDLVNFILRDLRTAMNEELNLDRGIYVPVANEIAHAIAGRVAAPVVAYFEAVPAEVVMTWPHDLALARARQMLLTSWRFKDLGRFEEGVRLTTPTLALREGICGPDALETAESLSALASLISGLGDIERALPLEERAMAIREKALGPDDPITGASVNNLAIYASDMGDEAEALRLHERALAIDERVHGPDHTQTALSLANLGAQLQTAGEYAAARAHLERALDIQERVLGPEHPEVARVLATLSNVHRALGDLDTARSLLVRALAIRERELGPSHIDTARLLTNLAALHRQAGDYAAARPLLDRALAINEKALGPDHPATASVLNGIAILLMSDDDYAGARPYMLRVAAITEKTQGPESPRTASMLNNLAIMHRELGELAAARPLYERALAIREKALGPDHPATAESLDNFALLLLDLGEPLAALDLSRRALAINQKAFGPDHRDVAMSSNNIASALSAAGDADAARQTAERALDIVLRALGPDHPATRAVRANLARILVQQARARAAAGDQAAAASVAAEALALLPTANPDGYSSSGSGDVAAGALRAEALHLAGQTDAARAEVLALVEAGFPHSIPKLRAAEREAFVRLCEEVGVTPPAAPAPQAAPASPAPSADAAPSTP